MEDNKVGASPEVCEAQLRFKNAIAAKKLRTQSAHADHAKVMQVTSNTQIQSEKKQNSEVQSVSELETQTRVVNKQNFVAKSVSKDGIQDVNKPKAKEDNARTDSIHAGHADALEVIDEANQLEKELAKYADELREAQMKFIHCKNTIAAQKDINLRKNREDMAAQSFSKDEWNEVKGKKSPSKAKTDEEEEQYLNLDNMEDNKVGASPEVCEAQLRFKNAIAAKKLRTQSAHADHAKVMQVTSNTQIQSEKKQNSEVQSVSELETHTRVVNKQNFMAKSVSKDGIQDVNKPKAKEDNARTDSIHAGHADALEVIDEANQLEKELAKYADELREAQMKFIHCKNTIAAQKDIALRKNREDMAAQSFSKDEWNEVKGKKSPSKAKTDEEEEQYLNLDNMEDNKVGASPESEKKQNSEVQSVSELETQTRVVNKQNFVAKSVSKDGIQDVNKPKAKEDNARTDSIHAGHADALEVIDEANQLEKELAKYADELREAQMKFIHCKNTIAAQKDIALRKNREDMAAQSFSKDEWNEVKGKKSPSKAKTDEEEEQYLNLDNMEDNKVGASPEVCEAQLRFKNAIAAKKLRTQSAHADHAKVMQVTSNTQIQSEKKQNSEVQSVSELETHTRVVNKQNFMAKSVSKDGIQDVNKPKAKEDNARTDSIHAGHADALEVIDEANQLEKELAKYADELREAQMKFIHCKNTIAAQKDIALRKNREDMAAQSFSKDEWNEVKGKKSPSKA
ncbi:ELKS/Rab6-interacting/CAST family member 1-like [Papaver somniferum]|uniref:ELKS/Rab6-interacting/CAST family member 1-like n=1 Tax=Papaver somniferum TaxID=3469 RepID=UPI000E6F9440|nr:ELKS/Rab6-interacting/CAST family member 1-like [Papaver somniferum]